MLGSRTTASAIAVMALACPSWGAPWSRPTVLAGSAWGTPADSPERRVDPNVPESRFSGVVSIGILEDPTTGAARIGSGVLISPTHVLTAAHLFDRDHDGVMEPPAGDVRVNFNAGPRSIHRVASYVTHPDYRGFFQSGHDDLAIVTLSSPAPAAVRRYAWGDDPINAVGEFAIVGYGRSGFGDAGSSVISSSWTTKRVGWNVVDAWLADDEGSGRVEVFRADFDSPEAGLGNDRESTIAPGDSGGPAFAFDAGGEPVLFGINTFLFGVDNPSGLPTFGSGFGGQVVSGYAQWIEAMTGIPEPCAGLSALLGLVAMRRNRLHRP
jgi:hypothetical protein